MGYVFYPWIKWSLLEWNQVYSCLWSVRNNAGLPNQHPYTASHNQPHISPPRAAQMASAFGQSLVDYVVNLCHGQIDYIEKMPDDVLCRIIKYTDLKDIGVISCLNKRFHRVRMTSENNSWISFVWNLLFKLLCLGWLLRATFGNGGII